MEGAGSGKGAIRAKLLEKHSEYFFIDPDQIKESILEYQLALEESSKKRLSI